MKQELFNNKTKAEDYQRQPKQLGLYEASHEHDACGVGMLVNIQGGKSHELVESALKVLENMRHRGAEGADNKTGDGAGIMLPRAEADGLRRFFVVCTRPRGFRRQTRRKRLYDVFFWRRPAMRAALDVMKDILSK